MNQTNQLQSESQHYKPEAKKVFENQTKRQKVQDCVHILSLSQCILGLPFHEMIKFNFETAIRNTPTVQYDNWKAL